MAINFKAGLTEAQKAGITALASKPVAQWSATDKANWNYATNSSPLPTTPVTKQTTNTTTPTATQPKKATLYGPNGQTQVVDVGSQQASQLQTQGWGLTAGSYKAPQTTTTSPASTATKKATLYGPDGQVQVVDVGSQVASQLQSAGWGLTAGSYKAPAAKTDATQPTTTTDPNKSKADAEALAKMGIDTTGLSPDQIATLAAMNQVMTLNADKNKQIVPATLTPQEMQKFLQDAHAELDPYYQEVLKLGETAILNTVADLTGDVAYRGQQLLETQDAERNQLAEQMAEQGLAFSGIRNKATDQQLVAQQGLVRSQASQYQKQLRDNALQFEKTYGSDALRKLNIPNLNYAGVQIAAPQPLGSMMGEQKKMQTVEEQLRQIQLAQQELLKRNTQSGAINPYPVTA